MKTVFYLFGWFFLAYAVYGKFKKDPDAAWYLALAALNFFAWSL